MTGGSTLRIPSVAERTVVPGPPLFSLPIAVRWSDLDADGRVNNTVILRYCEEARMQWLQSLGLAVAPQPCFPVLASMGCRYEQAVRYTDSLVVDVYCARMGHSSMDVFFHVRGVLAPRPTHAVVAIVWVWIDARAERPVPVPQLLRERCAASTA